MRTRHDRLVKQILGPLVEQMGSMLTEAEVVSTARRLDFAIVPSGRRDPAAPPHIRPGILDRVAEECSVVEHFSEAVELEEVLRCIEKLIGWDRQLSQSPPAGFGTSGLGLPRGERPPFPNLWILSAGVPVTALQVLDCPPKPGWPPGVYSLLGRGGIVVLSELPATPYTLIFRLLGKGKVQRQALKDLLDLPKDAYEKKVALPAMKAFYGEIMGRPVRTRKEEKFIRNTGDLFEKYEQDLMDKGRQEEALEILTLQLRQRFGPIPASRHSQLADASLDDLNTWLKRVLVAESLDEVFEKQSIVDSR